MANRDLSLSLRLYADTARFVSGLVSGERGVRGFTSGVKREFESLKSAMSSVEGKLASVGVSVGAVATIIQSAKMDKSLSQIGQTAGASEADVAGLRAELFRMSSETGQNVDDLQQGFNNAVQAGLQFNEALPVIDAVNKAMAVTGANADSLAGSLTVAGTAFDFDLAKPQLANTLLDKMTVAGRLGNAELENLSSIFGRIGPNAAAAGFGFDKTLAFIEGLSQIERQPERLATLADSTLRLFTNLKILKDAQKATGVKFFDAAGSRRDALAVLADIKKQYDKLGTEKARSVFIQKAFGNADLDTIKGMRVLLSGDTLGKVNEFAGKISGAGGTIERDLDKALSNSIDQVGRLKAELRNAADGFSKPVNDTVSKLIKYSLDSKKNGGLGLDGKEILAGAGIGSLALFGAARYGGKAIGSLAKRFGGTAAGLAEGKALEAAAGVTPVFVVNMPGGGINALNPAGQLGTAAAAGGGAFAAKNLKTTAALLGGSSITGIRMLGAGAIGTSALAVAGSGAAGFGVGTLAKKGIDASDQHLGTNIGHAIGRTVAIYLAPFSSEARQSLTRDFKQEVAEFSGILNIKLDQDGKVLSTSVKTNQPKMRLNVHAGPSMVTN